MGPDQQRIKEDTLSATEEDIVKTQLLDIFKVVPATWSRRLMLRSRCRAPASLRPGYSISSA